jgi:hypothetical protein
MSLHPKPIGEIPEETRRIAQTAFPKGNLYMKMRDELGTFYRDEDFEKLYPTTLGLACDDKLHNVVLDFPFDRRSRLVLPDQMSQAQRY